MLLQIFPGLIKGAASGKGLGNIFLKHVERTKVLVFLIDLNDKDISETYKMLKNELESHDSKLLKKPSLILLTKSDSVQTDQVSKFKNENIESIVISSLSGENIDKAISSTINLLV